MSRIEVSLEQVPMLFGDSRGNLWDVRVGCSTPLLREVVPI